MGFTPNKDQLKLIATEVKALGDSGKSVTDTDLYAIAKNIMNIKGEETGQAQGDGCRNGKHGNTNRIGRYSSSTARSMPGASIGNGP